MYTIVLSVRYYFIVELISQTHLFLLLLTAWQPRVDCAPLALLDRTCGGTSAAGGLRSTRCSSGDAGFTRLLSSSWNMQ